MDSAEALRKIIREARHAPSQLICDADPGSQTKAFKELLEEHKIQQTTRVGRNDLATVDRLIGISSAGWPPMCKTPATKTGPPSCTG